MVSIMMAEQRSNFWFPGIRPDTDGPCSGCRDSILTLNLTLEIPGWKTPRKHAVRGYCVEAMTHDGALLLSADQTPLAERDLSALAKCLVNPLDYKGNYSATSNNIKLVHWPLMGTA